MSNFSRQPSAISRQQMQGNREQGTGNSGKQNGISFATRHLLCD